jgi:hypothetical protein
MNGLREGGMENIRSGGTSIEEGRTSSEGRVCQSTQHWRVLVDGY